MCTTKWEPSRISWEIWYSCYHFQVSLPDHGESTVSTMKAMYSIMEPDLSCFNLWQVCFLSLYLPVNMNAPSIITRYHQHKLIFSFLAFYLYESEVGWAPHERRYWSRCHKRINRFCSSFSCYKRKASWFVQTILHAFLRISLLFSSLGHTRFSFFLFVNPLVINMAGFLQLAGGTNAHTVDGLRKVGLFQATSFTSNILPLVRFKYSFFTIGLIFFISS